MSWLQKVRQIYAVIVWAVRAYDRIAARLSAGSDPLGSDTPVALLAAEPDLPADVTVPCPESTGLIADGYVTRVIDGDTLEVECRFSHRVRLIDCWCKETTLRMGTTPEEKERGLKAKAFMEGCLLSTTSNHVRILIPGHNGDLTQASTLSRVLGRAWLLNPETKKPEADTDLSSIMVRAGMATKTKEG